MEFFVGLLFIDREVLADRRFDHSFHSTTHADVSTKIDGSVSLEEVVDEEGLVFFQDVLDVDDFVWLG